MGKNGGKQDLEELKMETQAGEKLYFSTKHEWAKSEEGLYLIGISDYAQKALGDIVYLDISVSENADIKKGANFGVVESVKALEDLYAPLAGQVVAVNSELKAAPEKINQDAHASWIIKIKAKHEKKDLAELMDAKAYGEYLEGLS